MARVKRSRKCNDGSQGQMKTLHGCGPLLLCRLRIAFCTIILREAPTQSFRSEKKITSESGIESVECTTRAVKEADFHFVQPWIDSIIKSITHLLDGIWDQQQHHGGSEHFSQVNLSGCHLIAGNGGRDT